MKKIIFILLFAGLATLTFSQDKEASLKKDIVSADMGLFSAWVNYERHLAGLFTLKSSVGLGFSFGQDIISGTGTYYVFTPIFKVEPRYYYNFNSRVQQGKKNFI